MKKLALLMAVLMLVASPSFASVGIKVDGVNQGVATDLNFENAGSSLTNDGSTWTFNLLLAGFANGGATSMVTSDLAVPVGYAYVRKAVATDSAFSAGTLADGTPGQLLTIYITTVNGGSVTYTLTPTTKTGFTSLAFNAAGDVATLLFVDSTTGWMLLSQTSVTVNP